MVIAPIDWFHGFKLHMIINDKSEIVAIKITEGNVDDRKAFEEMAIKKDLKGKCYADRSYLSKDPIYQVLSKKAYAYYWYKAQYEKLFNTYLG